MTQDELKAETKSGIKYGVLLEGYGEDWRNDGVQTTVVASVAFDDAGAFVADMVGGTRHVGSSLLRDLPEQNPYTVSPQWCVACQLVELFGNHGVGLGGWIRADNVKYQLTFQTLPYKIKTDDDVQNELERYVVRKRRVTTRELTIPGTGFHVYRDPDPDDGTRVFVGAANQTTLSFIDLEYVWKQIPITAIPDEWIKPYAGKINAITFEGCEPETLLFVGVEEDRYFTAAGQFVADLTYNLRYQQQGWNHFPQPDGTFVRLINDAGKGLYSKVKGTSEDVDFKNLFKASTTGGAPQ